MEIKFYICIFDQPNMRKKMELEKSLDILVNMVNEDSLKPQTYTWVLKLLQCNFYYFLLANDSMTMALKLYKMHTHFI